MPRVLHECNSIMCSFAKNCEVNADILCFMSVVGLA